MWIAAIQISIYHALPPAAIFFTSIHVLGPTSALLQVPGDVLLELQT